MTFCEQSADDETIENEDLLVRAIHPKHWVPVLGANGMRPAGIGFNESTDGTGASVNLCAILEGENQAKTFVVPALVAKRKDHGFVEFLAEVPRSNAAKLVRMPEEDNPAHAVMCGLSDDAKSALSRRSTVLTYGKPTVKKP